MLKIGEKRVLDLSYVSQDYSGQYLHIAMQAVGSGKVITVNTSRSHVISHSISVGKLATLLNFYEIYYGRNTIGLQNLRTLTALSVFTSEVKLYIRSLGFSLIAERPVRREFVSLYLLDVAAKMILSEENKLLNIPKTKVIDFSINDIQIDNYSESAVYPVLLHRCECYAIGF